MKFEIANALANLAPGQAATVAGRGVRRLHLRNQRLFEIVGFERWRSLTAEEAERILASAAPRQQRDAADRMAAVMAERAASAGSCTEDDLRRAGFTGAEIIECAERARERAAAIVRGRRR